MRLAALVPLLAAACGSARADGDALGGKAVLDKYCSKCHGGDKAEGDFGFVRDTPRLVASGLVVPGDAPASLVYRRVVAGEMPPEHVKARPTATEIAALRAWIDGMQTATKFRRDADLNRLLAADAAKLARDDRAAARWFSLAHLANAGVPEAQLDRYRTAFAKLVASLTWSPSPRAPVALDAERTLYRIDLRELGWSTATWDAIRAAYPYGVAHEFDVPDAIRIDWFVATASRSPLYHDILALPDTADALARRLGVDMALDIANSRVARAGFTGSGVSVNNRVIERHVTRHGALWRSYDFRSSVDRENVFAHPLDFVPAGGEIIFNLPDGFQAYMLVDANGRRIDKAPTAIVSDPHRPDRAVENGLSCMGCHAAGVIDKTDQLRGAVDTLETAWERDRVRALHPAQETLAALYAQDRARFTTALSTIGASVPAESSAEPIALLAQRYEADLDLRHAAAELGLRDAELAARLARSEPLRRAFGGLAVTGGTVKRDSWAAAFPRSLVELGLGVPFTPHTSYDASPAVFIDRAHVTWVLLDQRVDQATAAAQCKARSLELPRVDELIAAVDQGLAAAIRVDEALWSSGAKLDASNQRFASVVDPATGGPRRADVAERHAAACMQR